MNGDEDQNVDESLTKEEIRRRRLAYFETHSKENTPRKTCSLKQEDTTDVSKALTACSQILEERDAGGWEESQQTNSNKADEFDQLKEQLKLIPSTNEEGYNEIVEKLIECSKRDIVERENISQRNSRSESLSLPVKKRRDSGSFPCDTFITKSDDQSADSDREPWSENQRKPKIYTHDKSLSLKPQKVNSIDELFVDSVRQHPVKTKQRQSVRDSQETKVAFQKSVDLEHVDNIGLQTHRPDSERDIQCHNSVDDFIKNKSPRVLNEVVSGELKYALGEKKYREFLEKSMKEIDQLQIDKSEESNPTVDNNLVDFEKKDSKIAGLPPKPRPKLDLKSNIDLQHLKEYDENSDCDRSSLTNGTFTEITKTDFDRGQEPNRPLLNRPKYDPVKNVYQSSNEGQDLKESSVSFSQRNYEQVTVPRNVVFSSSEIYQQAYKGGLAPQSFSGVSGSPSMLSYPPEFGINPVVLQQMSTVGYPYGLYDPPPSPYFASSPPAFHQPSSPMSASVPYMHPLLAMQGGLHHSVNTPPHASHPPDGGGPIHNCMQQMTNRNFASYDGSDVMKYMKQFSINKVPHPPETKPPTADMKPPLPNNIGKHQSQSQKTSPNIAYHIDPYSQQVISARGSQSGEYAEFKHYLQAMPQGIPYPPPPDNVDLQAYFQLLGSQGYAIPYPMFMVPKPPENEETQTTEAKSSGHNSTFNMKIPHPPPQKKSIGMSPRQGQHQESTTDKWKRPDVSSKHRRNSQGEILCDGNNSSQRHIDGIRQHHEQKRYQQEEEIMLDKQRKFARASIDRYFNSLENLYLHSKAADSGQPAEQHNSDIKGEVEESMANENETVVNTDVSGTTSIKAGGITDRMEKLGIDLSFLRESKELGREEPARINGHVLQGDARDHGGSSSNKLVIVCPECGEINKQYMTWCGDCREPLMGIEPIVVSKGSKARTKRKISRKQDNRQDKNVTFVDCGDSGQPDNSFLQTGNDSSEYEESPKGKNSPNKSESRDSGRPSSEDLDFGRTEKEVIDICETITDPVVKGFIKSYFNRKKNVLEETKKVQDDMDKDKMVEGHNGKLQEESQPPSRDTEISLDLHEDNIENVLVDEDVWLHERDLIQKMNQPLKGKKSGPIDIEVFTMEESRQSRNSSRMEPLVPSLNLVNSSDEEEDEKVLQGPLRPMSMSANSEDWEGMFQPPVKSAPIPKESEAANEEEPRQPFLAQLIVADENVVKAEKPQANSKSRKLSPNKSKVRSSIEAPGYQRHWQRSSVAWNSYHPRELSTNSSEKVSSSSNKPSNKSHSLGPRHAGSMENLFVQESEESSSRSKTVGSGRKARPSSADLSKRKLRPSSATSRTRGSTNAEEGQIQPKRPLGEPSTFCATPPRTPKEVSARPLVDKTSQQRRPKSCESSSTRKHSSHKSSLPFSSSKKTEDGETTTTRPDKGGSLDSPPSNLPYVVDHRLPAEDVMEQPMTAQTNAVSVMNAYSKYYEMTPRIQKGKFSAWLCLPDEILLHIFSYLSHSDLVKCALTCTQFHRVAADETLWRYVTVKKKHRLNDDLIVQIGKRHPASLALIQCHGDDITAKGLRDLFRECAEGLRELNFCGCSRGALTGDCILLHASARCHCLTHIDASWCHVTDSGIGAISGSSNRLECLCINGCQMISDEGLETVIKKHGKSLRHLEMFGCFNITPKGMRYLANHCINLTTLNLGQCYKLTDSCITQLSASLGRVENLDLRGCKQIKDNCIRNVVKNCPRLKTITLANCPNITDVSMLEISTYVSDIRNIDVCGCRNITDNSIRALANNCQNMCNIDISSTGCTHRSVSMLANFCNQRLESVKLNFLCDVTDTVLIKLAKHCKRLKLVHLYGCTSIRNSNKIREANPGLVVEL